MSRQFLAGISECLKTVQQALAARMWWSHGGHGSGGAPRICLSQLGTGHFNFATSGSGNFAIVDPPPNLWCLLLWALDFGQAMQRLHLYCEIPLLESPAFLEDTPHPTATLFWAGVELWSCSITCEATIWPGLYITMCGPSAREPFLFSYTMWSRLLLHIYAPELMCVGCMYGVYVSACACGSPCIHHQSAG